MDDSQRGMALMAAGYGFGAAGLVAPRLVTSAFGLNDVGEDYVALLRGFSTRNLALAGVFQMVSGEARLRKRFFTVAAAMFSADTALALASAVTGKVGWRPALSLGLTTAALAALAASGAAGD